MLIQQASKIIVKDKLNEFQYKKDDFGQELSENIKLCLKYYDSDNDRQKRINRLSQILFESFLKS